MIQFVDSSRSLLGGTSWSLGTPYHAWNE